MKKWSLFSPNDVNNHKKSMEELRVVRESKAKFRIARDDEPTMEDRDNYRDWTWHLTHPQQETFGGLSDEWIIQSARSQAIMTGSIIGQTVVGFDQSSAAIVGLTQTEPGSGSAQSQSAMAGLVKSQATFAGLASEPHFMPLMIERDLVKPALEIVQQIENENIVNQARGILLILQKTITTFHYYGFPFSHLPSLHAVNVEDGSTLIEWIFDDFRIGFSVESDRDESSWYLVSSKKLREINASGYIPSGNEFEKLILWLLNFVISHT